MSREKGVSLIHRFRNRASMHNLGFCGSIVIGRTKWGGLKSPTRPQTRIAPVSMRCKSVSVTNCENMFTRVVVFKGPRWGIRAVIVNAHKGPPKRPHEFLDIYTLPYPLKDIFGLVVTLQNILPEVNACTKFTGLEKLGSRKDKSDIETVVSPRTM